MIYNIIFYLCVFVFFIHSYIGNVDMIEQSFKGLVICGFINTFSKLNNLNRR